MPKSDSAYSGRFFEETALLVDTAFTGEIMVNKEVEQWAIHGVIPGEYETYGDNDEWILQTDPYILNLVGGGIVYHDHGQVIRCEIASHRSSVIGETGTDAEQRVLYSINSEGRCRNCNVEAPPGVRFRAKTWKLQGADR